MGWYPWGKKQTPVLRKVNRYHKDPHKAFTSKRNLMVYIPLFIVSWAWSLPIDLNVSVWGNIGMLFFGFLIYKSCNYIFRADPVQNAINDLEQQFWYRDYKKDFGSALE